MFPSALGPVGGVTGAPANLSQTLQLIQEINALLRTPGATLTWQPLGAATRRRSISCPGRRTRLLYRRRASSGPRLRCGRLRSLSAGRQRRGRMPRRSAVGASLGSALTRLVAHWLSSRPRRATARLAACTGRTARAGGSPTGEVRHWQVTRLRCCKSPSRVHRRHPTARPQPPPCPYCLMQTITR